jgi:hypothetical protein
MKRLMVLVVLGCAVAIPATAQGAGTARWYTHNLAAAMHKEIVKIDNSGPFTGASCLAYDGNAAIGWLHISCAGNVNHGGTTYRYKAIYTPKGCDHETVALTIFGAEPDGSDYRRTVTSAFVHDIFSCKVS